MDRQAEDVGDRQENAFPPPNGDAVIRALEGIRQECLKKKFFTLHQGDPTVVEFVRNFDRGCHFVALIARDAAKKLRHFLDAATAYAFQAEQALKDIVFEMQCKRVAGPTTFEVAVSRALAAEQDLIDIERDRLGKPPVQVPHRLPPPQQHQHKRPHNGPPRNRGGPQQQQQQQQQKQGRAVPRTLPSLSQVLTPSSSSMHVWLREMLQDLLQKFGKGGTSFSYIDDLHRETKSIEEGIHAAIHSEQVGDESSSWKKVLHEESSQYYYWNILTGETSWEVPDVLTQAAVVSHLEKTVGDTSGTSVDVEQEDATFEKLKKGSEAIYKTSGNSSKGAEADGFEEGSKGDSLDCKSGTHFSAHLLKHCDILLERLNSLESLNWNMQWQDIKLKYKLEVEIRLSDIMTLASHGSALLQFWLYTEEQLKRLDAAIDDAIRQYGSAPIGEYEATVKSQEAFKVDSNEKKGPCQAAKESNHPDSTFEKSHIEAYSDLGTTTGLVSSVVNPITCSNTETEGKDEIIGLEVHSEIIAKSVVYCGEEVDMDVDMEVEDTSASLKSSIGGASGAHYDILSHEQSNLQHPPAVHEPLLQGQMFSVQPPATSWIHQLSLENGPCPPPPPDNEPFPPPPPDDYPFPPPPPDEPPETSYPPPSHFESVHSLPYSEHYVLAYPSSNLDYFGQSNTEISGATLYSHPEGVQVSASHITPYYEPVSNI
ncbi:uncharacterized protein LOC142537635 [Primulina tabacum]|uniref:uncharacterized protein LOC142537635 n=1 Tax=Primulina tabacum TaxID=48773 RepID=UPI003F5AADCC